MSLAKRKELADLKAKVAVLDERIGAAYHKIKDAAMVAVNKDFRAFFMSNGFTVENSPAKHFGSAKPGLVASYQNMKATLEVSDENPYYFTIQSNIKATGATYTFRVVTVNPKTVNSSFARFKHAKDEATQLDFDLEDATRYLGEREASSSGLTETVASIQALSEEVRGKKTSISKEDKSLTSLLESLFN